MPTRIDPAHWNAFLLFLKTVERGAVIPIAFDSIRDVIWTQRAGKYDNQQSSVVCTAMADPDMLDLATESGFILVACSADFPQPSRQSFGAPTLSLKILEMPKDPGASRTFPFAYDLFADGRHDLVAMSTAVPEYLRLVTWLVESFPDRHDHRTMGPKKWAFEDLLSA